MSRILLLLLVVQIPAYSAGFQRMSILPSVSANVNVQQRQQQQQPINNNNNDCALVPRRSLSPSTISLKAQKQRQAGEKSSKESPTPLSTAHATNGVVKNLFSVCAHIQNPELYPPAWADNAVLQQQKLVTKSARTRGQILSLYPIHALGLRTPLQAKRKKPKQNQKNPSKNNKKQKARDFVVFDVDKDGAYFAKTLSDSMSQSQPLFNKYRVNHVDLPFLMDGAPQQREVFLDVNPTNAQHATTPGWVGHMATKLKTTDDDHNEISSESNCMVVPIPGAAPLCALVATTAIEEGVELVVASEDKEISYLYALLLEQTYAAQVKELGNYLAMAYQPPFQPLSALGKVEADDKAEGDDATAEAAFTSPFHSINLDYPGLRYLHRDPDILVIDNFLSDEECDRITTNAKSHMIPCVIKHPTTGIVQEDPSRTSTNANMPRSDVPSIVDKMVELTSCKDATHLETLQILRYTKGQTFYPHTDGFQGETTACGFENSGRLVTIFCYLNDVEEGGETRFTKLTSNDSNDDGQVVSIAPRKGMAVLHFPSTTGFEEDPSTEHEGSVAIDEKWLLVSWMWKDARVDPAYAEDLFPSIMGDN